METKVPMSAEKQNTVKTVCDFNGSGLSFQEKRMKS